MNASLKKYLVSLICVFLAAILYVACMVVNRNPEKQQLALRLQRFAWVCFGLAVAWAIASDYIFPA